MQVKRGLKKIVTFVDRSLKEKGLSFDWCPRD